MMLGAAAASGLAQNKWTPIVAGVVIIGVAGIAYLGIIRPVLCKTGVVNCKSSRNKEKLRKKIASFSGFSPTYYNPVRTTMNFEQAKILADKLHGCCGWTGDDEEIVYGVLRSAGSKDNLSMLSKVFQQRHGQSMGEFITGYMKSENELETIWNIINNY